MKTILIPAGQWLSEDVISQEDAERIISRWGSYEDYEQRQADIEAQQKAKASGIRSIK